MSAIRHLYPTLAEVLRLSGTLVHGTPTLTWAVITDMVDPAHGVPGQLKCRIDLGYLRIGRDAPMPVVAGRAPDRMGVMFLDATGAIKAGDRIHCIAGPIAGTFEIRPLPDPAVDMSAVHHLEVQVIEVAQAVHGMVPSPEPGP